MRIKFKSLRLLIREAARDQKQLQKINNQLIQKSKPALFSEQTLDLISELSDDNLNRLQNRKGFIKWFANIIEISPKKPSLEQVQLVVDYVIENNPNLERLRSFAEAFDVSLVWSFNLEKDIGLRDDNKIVYNFNNGYKIVELRQTDLKPEGAIMQNCLRGENARISDTVKVYSLRDSYNKPHANISIYDNKEIMQIKGKQNKVPIKKYSKMIIEWISTIPNKKAITDDYYDTLITASDDPMSLCLELLNSDSKNKDHHYFLAKNRLTPPKILTQLAKNSEVKIQKDVAKNTSTPPTILTQLAKNKNTMPEVASNTSTPSHVLKQLAEAEDEDTRANVAGNKQTPPHVLEQLAGDKEKVRRRVAFNRSTPNSILEKLAEDIDQQVRLNIIVNTTTSLQILKKLSQDRDYTVKRAALQALERRQG